VSPSNVLLSVEGEVKLCDFGIARVLTAGDGLPEEAIQGKAGYMSPEAARGDAVDARSDVFAAGIVLWELLAGQRLYRSGGGRPPPLEQARAAMVTPLSARGYPEEERLHSIVRQALAAKPAERYRSAQAMLSELEAYVADNRLVASALRFGDWLTEHFGAEIVERRRERERSAKDLDEASGRRESRRAESEPTGPADSGATPLVNVPFARHELPTMPDPDARLPPEAFPESSDPPAASSRPNRTLLVAVMVLVVVVFGFLGFLFGRK
jgi:serine/threonine-protein kinase